MPLIAYPCNCGLVAKKYVRSAKDATAFITCSCGKEVKRGFGATSVGHKIIVDNGLQARAVELQSADIMEINDERSQLDLTEDF